MIGRRCDVGTHCSDCSYSLVTGVSLLLLIFKSDIVFALHRAQRLKLSVRVPCWNASSVSVDRASASVRLVGTRRASASTERQRPCALLEPVERQHQRERRLSVSICAYSAYLCDSAGETGLYYCEVQHYVMLLLRERSININLTISGMFHQQLIF